LPWPASLAHASFFPLRRACWRETISKSYSGSIVTDDFVFITETKEMNTETDLASLPHGK